MEQTTPLAAGLRARLSFMMFLQYAIWGAWLPLMYPFLSRFREFAGSEIGYLFMIGGVGAVFAPFIAGQIADRYFNTERYLAISHILGGVLVWQLGWIDTFWMFFAFSLLYSLIYSPTLALTNSLSFHHLTDRDRQFGRIRLWGTIGWIVIGICIGQWLLHTYTPDRYEPAAGITMLDIVHDPEQFVAAAVRENPRQLEGVLTVDLVERTRMRSIARALEEAEAPLPLALDLQGREVIDVDAAALDISREELNAIHAEELGGRIVDIAQAKGISAAFRASAILGLLMGLYCLTLPRTPPARGAPANAVFEAIGEVRRQPLITLFLIAVPIACIHQFYFVHTAGFVGEFQTRAETVINRVFGVGGGGLMTIGQMSEILVLALIPFFARKLTRKSLLTIGIIAYALRMLLFAYIDPIAEATGVPEVAILMTGIALHGLCFGFFIFVAFMIVDEQTTADVRASAQSLFGLVVFGVGIVVGSIIAGYIGELASTNGVMNYRLLFAVPMWGAVGCLIALLVFYPGGRVKKIEPGGGAAGS